YPSNLWTIGYTPQLTTVVWAGNTDGTKLNYKGNGLEGAGPIWRDFMEYAHIGKPAEVWKKPSGVKEINVSEISGLLPNPETTNSSLIIKSLFINKPVNFDNSYRSVEVDSLCNGKITDKTPEAAIKTVTLVEFNSINPTNSNWQNPVIEWSKSPEFIKKYGEIPNLITEINDLECERSGIPSEITIRAMINDLDTFSAGENYIELAFKSSNPIIRIDVLLGDTLIDEIKIDNKKDGSYAGKIFIPASQSGQKTILTLRAVDDQYYSNTVENEVLVVRKDTTPPEIILQNPIDGSIKLYETDYFNLKAHIVERNSLKVINIKLDGNLIKTGLTDRNLVFPINENRNITPGKHIITIEVIDNNFNKAIKDIKLEVIER
ncbi:MAG: hypothetical protein QM490_00620, partial [Candidatus Gracilibacteria bacterium]